VAENTKLTTGWHPCASFFFYSGCKCWRGCNYTSIRRAKRTHFQFFTYSFNDANQKNFITRDL